MKPQKPEDKNHFKKENQKKLISAIKENNLIEVKKFIHTKINLDFISAEDNDETPLSVALRKECIEIIQELLKAGANPNKNNNGKTALSVACNKYQGDPKIVSEIVKILLQHGANPNLFKKGTDGPLHYTAMYGYCEAARLLLENGADINAKGGYKRTPLIYAASSGRSLVTVKLLIDYGADIHSKNDSGENALFELITREEANTDIAELLIKSGINIQEHSKSYGTALHWAAFCGRLNIVKLLVEKGSNINEKDKNKNLPIHKAMSQNKIDVVKYLFESGTIMHPPGLLGMYVLEYAVEKNDYDFVTKIVEKHKKENIPFPNAALTKAAKAGNIKLLGYLIESGISPDAKDYWGDETPLMKAAYNGKIEAVMFLLQKGADIKAKDSRGNTALLHASWAGHTGIVKMLLEKGAYINEKNNLNWNALMQACVEGHFDIVKLLLEKGSPVDEIDREQGATALTLAKHSKNQKLIELLINYGAEERKIRKREQNNAWFSVLECDICKYLPQKKDLGRTNMPEKFDMLEVIYTEYDQPERYADETNIIYRCPNCQTYYHHHHYIDTEDAFVAGPYVNQYIVRYNLLRLKNILQKIEKKEELNELENTYHEIILKFETGLLNSTDIKPDFIPYIIESLTDYYLINSHYDLLFNNLLQNSNSIIALFTAYDLIILYKQQYYDNKFPCSYDYRDSIKEIRENAAIFFGKQIKKFKDCIKKFVDSENPLVSQNYKRLIDKAKYYKLNL